MNQPSGRRVVRPLELTAADIALANQLIDRCNRIDRLDLPIEVTPESAAGGLRFCLAWNDDRLVGILTMQGSDDVEVCLAVDPDFRRQGLGRALLEAAKDEIRREGKLSFLLVTDEGSAAGRAFVAAMGARYHNSEYRLLLDEGSVPTGRDWPRPVLLRQGTAPDIVLIARLLADSFGDEPAEVRPWVEHALSLENHRFFIGSVAGEPVGNIRTNYYGTTIYITAFGVIPEQRGRGFGRQMLLRTIDRLIDEKWPKILIEVATNNRNALGLYLSCGFKELTTYGYYDLEI